MEKIDKAISAQGGKVPSQMSRSMAELGFVGTKVHQGIVKTEDYRELDYPQAVKTFKTMGYDGSVSAALTMLKALASSAIFEIKVPEGASKDKAKFIEECMHDMDYTWGTYINEFLSIMQYGFAVHEIVFKQRNGFKGRKSKSSKYSDGKIGWAKLPSRQQSSITKWHYDPKALDELIGVEQAVPIGDGRFAQGVKSNSIIPIRKVLHFRHNPTHNNPQGNSPLKNCWLTWKYKSAVEEYEAVGVSRDLGGMPIIHLPPEYMSASATEEQKAVYEYMKTVVRNITANEQAGLIMPKFVDSVTKADLFKFELVSGAGSSGKSYDTDAILKRYDHRILMSFLADVMIMGGDSVGSYSLASSKEAAVVKMLKWLMSEVLEVINTDLIPYTFRINGWDDVVFPEIQLKDIEQASLDEVGKFIQRIVPTGAMEMDKGLSDFLREQIELPTADKAKPIDVELTSQKESEAGNPTREDPSADNSTVNSDNAS